jgi:DnaJ like chaperone protein
MSNANPSNGTKNILIFCAVAAGFAIGGMLGGQVGSILAGTMAFAASLFVAEKLESSRGAQGFWLRYRGAFLEFGLVVLGITIGAGLLAGFWGFLIGQVAGTWAGSWLGERWGWTGRALQDQMEFRSNYLAVLVSAADADGVITPKERGRITEVGKEIFSYLGYGGDQDVAGIVEALAARPVPVADAARYIGVLAPEIQEMLKFDILKIIYCDGDPSPRSSTWLEQCMRDLGSTEWTLLRYFDRALTLRDHSRREWLDELGLGEGAGIEEVRAAYRMKAMEYHPDKLECVPPQIRALAEAKMASINAAYDNLMGAAPPDSTTLHFREPGKDRSFRPAEGVESHCQCWLCGRTNRIPERARPETCRCGSCHSFVGLTFDPIAA